MLLASSSYAVGAFDGSGNLRAAGPCHRDPHATTTTGTSRPLDVHLANVAAGAATRTRSLVVKIAVYGKHGLDVPSERRGRSRGGFTPRTSSLTSCRVLRRCCPRPGSRQTDFVIPHIVFLDPVTAEDAILEANKYHLYEWGVYDNREFFYRAPNPDRLTWQARLDEGARVDLEGDTAEQVFNGVVVSYTDAVGLRKTVGPTSGPVGTFDDTDAALMDTSPDNPVNAHGIPRSDGEARVSAPTTLAGATAIGAAYLARRVSRSVAATLTLQGTVQHPTEGHVPVWRVRAGDYITLTQGEGIAGVPRRIIETRYDHWHPDVERNAR